MTTEKTQFRLSSHCERHDFTPRDVGPWLEFALRTADTLSICGEIPGSNDRPVLSCAYLKGDRPHFVIRLIHGKETLIDATLDSRDVAAGVLRSAVHRMAGLTAELTRRAQTSVPTPVDPPTVEHDLINAESATPVLTSRRKKKAAGNANDSLES